MLAHDEFSRWLGVELLDVKPERVTIRMVVRQDMTNGFGVCHGGVTFAFADSAFAFASNTGGQVSVSIENSMTYPAAVRVGDVLLAEAGARPAAQTEAPAVPSAARSAWPPHCSALRQYGSAARAAGATARAPGGRAKAPSLPQASRAKAP